MQMGCMLTTKEFWFSGFIVGLIKEHEVVKGLRLFFLDSLEA
jgi:hypothetical protein